MELATAIKFVDSSLVLLQQYENAEMLQSPMSGPIAESIRALVTVLKGLIVMHLGVARKPTVGSVPVKVIAAPALPAPAPTIDPALKEQFRSKCADCIVRIGVILNTMSLPMDVNFEDNKAGIIVVGMLVDPGMDPDLRKLTLNTLLGHIGWPVEPNGTAVLVAVTSDRVEALRLLKEYYAKVKTDPVWPWSVPAEPKPAPIPASGRPSSRPGD